MPITSWDMDKTEIQYYKKHRGKKLINKQKEKKTGLNITIIKIF